MVHPFVYLGTIFFNWQNVIRHFLRTLIWSQGWICTLRTTTSSCHLIWSPTSRFGVKAILFWLDRLLNYHEFTVTLANIMTLVPKEVKVGYTVSWKKSKKGHWNRALRLMMMTPSTTSSETLNNSFSQNINTKKVKKNASDSTSIQSIADNCTIILHNFKKIQENVQKLEAKSTVHHFF